ncbi:MAG TPA: hypothetical protein VLJ20_07450 [Acetobacteraceae bacterium]|nr:hypothetical protein [Acetobacteraceae bacterium]
MRKILFLSTAVLGLALTGPGLAQTATSPTGSQGTGSANPRGHGQINKGDNATPDATSGASNYTGHGRMGTNGVGSTSGTAKGGPSENAGSDGGSTGSNSPGQIHRP